jgi:hypothetical protein
MRLRWMGRVLAFMNGNAVASGVLQVGYNFGLVPGESVGER